MGFCTGDWIRMMTLRSTTVPPLNRDSMVVGGSIFITGGSEAFRLHHDRSSSSSAPSSPSANAKSNYSNEHDVCTSLMHDPFCLCLPSNLCPFLACRTLLRCYLRKDKWTTDCLAHVCSQLTGYLGIEIHQTGCFRG